MHKIFSPYKTAIERELSKFLKRKHKELGAVNQWGSDVCNRYQQFISQGKMIRGCLTILGFEMFGKKAPPEIVKVASAMEFFQSALLIHDDIMDRDTTRRGMSTIFIQYQTLGKKQNLPDWDHFGQSMGICAGDIGFFFAFELLTNIDDHKHATLPIISTELIKVIIAQMQDVYFGNQTAVPAKADILNVYRYKTARYTFSLPLMVGAIMAGQSDEVIQTLGEIGENMGIVFQLKDDELGLFGTEEKIGKPVGSDIREGKKTLFYCYLLEKASKEEKMKLQTIFGNSDITSEDVHLVQTLLMQYKIPELMNQQVDLLAQQTLEGIQSLPIKEEYREILTKLVQYNIQRST